MKQFLIVLARWAAWTMLLLIVLLFMSGLTLSFFRPDISSDDLANAANAITLPFLLFSPVASALLVFLQKRRWGLVKSLPVVLFAGIALLWTVFPKTANVANAPTNNLNKMVSIASKSGQGATEKESVVMLDGKSVNFADAIQNGADFQQIADWIKQGVSVNVKTGRGESALKVAISKRRSDVVRLLLEHGAGTGAQDNINSSASLFLAAAESGDRDIIKLLLANGLDINAITPGGLTAIDGGIDLEKPNVVKMLIESGANPNLKGIDGHTALMFAMHPLSASSRVNASIVQVLIDNGADVNARDRLGISVLEHAVLAGDPAVVRLLIERGASSNSDGHYGPIILLAASSGRTDIVKLLIDKGADVNAKSKSYNAGDTALMAAAYSGHHDVAKLLLTRGADAHVKGQRGRTMLMNAAVGANQKIVRLFLEMGLDINEKGVDNYNLLMAASSGGNPDIVKLALSKGLDVNTITTGKDTALMEAARKNDFIDSGQENEPMEAERRIDHIETVRLLLAAGADRNARNLENRRALDYAKDLVSESGGHDEIVKLLIAPVRTR